MELPNRKQRRLWARETGLLKKKKELPIRSQLEISMRAAETGKHIHLRNVEKNLNREYAKEEERKKKLKEKELERLQSDGLSLEDAMSALSKKESDDGNLDS